MFFITISRLHTLEEEICMKQLNKYNLCYSASCCGKRGSAGWLANQAAPSAKRPPEQGALHGLVLR